MSTIEANLAQSNLHEKRSSCHRWKRPGSKWKELPRPRTEPELPFRPRFGQRVEGPGSTHHRPLTIGESLVDTPGHDLCGTGILTYQRTLRTEQRASLRTEQGRYVRGSWP